MQSSSSLDTKSERLKSENEDNHKSDDSIEDKDNNKPKEVDDIVDSDSDKKLAHPLSDHSDSNKKLAHPLLDQVKNLIGSSKPDREMKIDPEGKQLQIDDLIIIPNNLATTPPEGGSALQNLAKIASRYQNQKEPPQQEGYDATVAKKPKLDGTHSPATPPIKAPITPTPPSSSSATSLAALAAMNPMSMTPAQQQSLLSMLPPGLFMPPTAKATPTPPHSSGVPAAATPTKSSTSVSGMASLFPPGLGDPSKLGPEALQLLQLYEKTLKAVVQATPSSNTKGSSASPKPRNASGNSSNVGSPQVQSAKDRDRNKVNRLPLDAKKPPAPQGHTPCAFAQSSNIYTNPLGKELVLYN